MQKFFCLTGEEYARYDRPRIIKIKWIDLPSQTALGLIAPGLIQSEVRSGYHQNRVLLSGSNQRPLDAVLTRGLAHVHMRLVPLSIRRPSVDQFERKWPGIHVDLFDNLWSMLASINDGIDGQVLFKSMALAQNPNVDPARIEKGFGTIDLAIYKLLDGIRLAPAAAKRGILGGTDKSLTEKFIKQWRSQYGHIPHFDESLDELQRLSDMPPNI